MSYPLSVFWSGHEHAWWDWAYLGKSLHCKSFWTFQELSLLSWAKGYVRITICLFQIFSVFLARWLCKFGIPNTEKYEIHYTHLSFQITCQIVEEQSIIYWPEKPLEFIIFGRVLESWVIVNLVFHLFKFIICVTEYSC